MADTDKDKYAKAIKKILLNIQDETLDLDVEIANMDNEDAQLAYVLQMQNRRIKRAVEVALVQLEDWTVEEPTTKPGEESNVQAEIH